MLLFQCQERSKNATQMQQEFKRMSHDIVMLCSDPFLLWCALPSPEMCSLSDVALSCLALLSFEICASSKHAAALGALGALHERWTKLISVTLLSLLFLKCSTYCSCIRTPAATAITMLLHYHCYTAISFYEFKQNGALSWNTKQARQTHMGGVRCTN